jgi:hypothetical protein
LDEGLANYHHKKQLDTEHYTRPRTSADSLERPKHWELVMKHYYSDEIKEHAMSRTCFACRGEHKCISSFVWGKWKDRRIDEKSWEDSNKMGFRWNGTVCGLDSTDSV